jgi:hypothetical protein
MDSAKWNIDAWAALMDRLCADSPIEEEEKDASSHQ